MPIHSLDKGSIRRSQAVTTYGVGSVVPVGDESVMIAGLDRWDVQAPDLHEPRLERQLGVRGFVLPPASDSGGYIPVVRFPMWYYCPNCRRLNRHSFFTSFADNKCSLCHVPLIPSRFVVACSRGHIDDFPYFHWVHAGHRQIADVEHQLSIRAGGVSASLRDIEISCSCGVPPRTMEGAFSREALRHVIGHCSGKRPWLGDNEPCVELPRALQRGATNVYFSVVRSALSIPPWSEGAFRRLNRHWAVLQYIPDEALAATIQGMHLQDAEYTVDDLVAAVAERKRMQGSGDTTPLTEVALREQEFEALMRGRAEVSRDQEFVCTQPVSTGETANWFDRVMLVKRLREVRALEAFTRLLPLEPGDPPERVAPLSATSLEWLPAVEVQGEGVFINLDARLLQEWERRADVVGRVEALDHRYEARFAQREAEADRVITPRLVLIHTLAHALIGEWSLASGYPAASLRERLYVSGSMSGLLIYTATSDAAGSLGGVVAQAEGNRLAEVLEGAIQRAAWCSSDPLCIEAEAAGADALNLAACHACVLLPEVSCEESNLLLDRALLVGTPTHPGLGFFASLLQG